MTEQELSALFDGRPKDFHDHLQKRAKELAPDYPYTEGDTPFTWLWALTSSLEGTRLANDDWVAHHRKLLQQLTIYQAVRRARKGWYGIVFIRGKYGEHELFSTSEGDEKDVRSQVKNFCKFNSLTAKPCP
jgi:hypothetical protein